MSMTLTLIFSGWERFEDQFHLNGVASACWSAFQSQSYCIQNKDKIALALLIEMALYQKLEF